MSVFAAFRDAVARGASSSYQCRLRMLRETDSSTTAGITTTRTQTGAFVASVAEDGRENPSSRRLFFSAGSLLAKKVVAFARSYNTRVLYTQLADTRRTPPRDTRGCERIIDARTSDGYRLPRLYAATFSSNTVFVNELVSFTTANRTISTNVPGNANASRRR